MSVAVEVFPVNSIRAIDPFAALSLMIPPNVPTSRSQTFSRVLLGLAMTLAGIGHLSFQRVAFQAQVPDLIPFSKDFVVLASGVVEIALGLAMVLLARYQVWVGLVLAVFFVAVFPGNISQYLNGIDAFGLNTDAKRLGRLFLQPVLIAWALWATGAISALRRSSSG